VAETQVSAQRATRTERHNLQQVTSFLQNSRRAFPFPTKYRFTINRRLLYDRNAEVMEFLTQQFGYDSRSLTALRQNHVVGACPSAREANQFRNVSAVRFRPDFTPGGASTEWSVRCQKGKLRVSPHAHDEGILTEAEMKRTATDGTFDRRNTRQRAGNGSCNRAYVRVYVKAANTKSVERFKIPTLHNRECCAITLSSIASYITVTAY
jgi:hypothetical protein